MIQGSNFHLRHMRRDEVALYTELINAPESKGDFLSLELNLPGVIEKKYETEAYSKEVRETFLIVDGHDSHQGKILGQIFHFKTVPYFNSREIGYALFSSDTRGKGLMTEAVTLLTDYLFRTMLINRLEIHMNTLNLASEKVAVRCGYRKEGIARGAVFSRGKHIDIAMYALLREEWEQLR